MRGLVGALALAKVVDMQGHHPYPGLLGVGWRTHNVCICVYVNMRDGCPVRKLIVWGVEAASMCAA